MNAISKDFNDRLPETAERVFRLTMERISTRIKADQYAGPSLSNEDLYHLASAAESLYKIYKDTKPTNTKPLNGPVKPALLDRNHK